MPSLSFEQLGFVVVGAVLVYRLFKEVTGDGKNSQKELHDIREQQLKATIEQNKVNTELLISIKELNHNIVTLNSSQEASHKKQERLEKDLTSLANRVVDVETDLEVIKRTTYIKTREGAL